MLNFQKNLGFIVKLMEEMMPRKFIYRGLITDETKIFYTNFREFKKIIDEGFAENFKKTEESQNLHRNDVEDEEGELPRE